jgi:hypothetical protein
VSAILIMAAGDPLTDDFAKARGSSGFDASIHRSHQIFRSKNVLPRFLRRPNIFLYQAANVGGTFLSQLGGAPINFSLLLG